MSNPNNSVDLNERRKLLELLELLDRLAAVDIARAPKFMPDVVIYQWRHGDPEARRTIEEEIDRLPKREKSN